MSRKERGIHTVIVESKTDLVVDSINDSVWEGYGDIECPECGALIPCEQDVREIDFIVECRICNSIFEMNIFELLSDFV